MNMQKSPPTPAGPQETFEALASMRTGTNERGFKLTPLEKSVERAVAKLVNQGADEYVMAMAELAMSLATNVAAGNGKGRAVANEATALRDVLASLQADRLDAAATADAAEGLPSGVVDFTAALAARPVVGGPEARSL